MSLEANVAVLGSSATLRGEVNGSQFSLSGTSTLTLAGYFCMAPRGAGAAV